MEYVTIKNGVATPIERKQLYMLGFVIRNRITALDWEGNTVTNETEINKNFNKENIPSTAERVHLIMTLANSSPYNFSGPVSNILSEYSYTGSVHLSNGVQIKIQRQEGKYDSNPVIRLFVSEGIISKNEIIEIPLEDNIIRSDDYTADIMISDTKLWVNNKVVYNDKKCAIAKKGLLRKNVEVEVGNGCRCKKVFLEYLNYE